MAWAKVLPSAFKNPSGWYRAGEAYYRAYGQAFAGRFNSLVVSRLYRLRRGCQLFAVAVSGRRELYDAGLSSAGRTRFVLLLLLLQILRPRRQFFGLPVGYAVRPA